jgi:predicted porin
LELEEIMTTLGQRISVLGAACVLYAQCAHAQQVALYGLMDLGVNYVSSGAKGNTNGKEFTVTSNVVQPSRWGLAGTEDLGGGLSAVFRLESGFFPENGTASQGLEFSRNATVGLKSRQWGQVDVGRQYDFMFDMGFYSGIVNGSGGFSGSAQTYNVDNRVDGVKVNNSVKYRYNYFDTGLGGGVMYGFGNEPGSVTAGSTYSATLVYHSVEETPFDQPSITGSLDKRRFTIQAAYTHARDPEFAPNLSPFLATPGYKGVQNAAVGGFYDLTAHARVFGFYSYSSVLGLSWRAADYVTGVEYGLTSKLLTTFDYTYVQTHNGTDKKGHANQITWDLDYYLSRRTDVYLAVGGEWTGGAAGDAYMFPASNDPSINSAQLVTRIGIRTFF